MPVTQAMNSKANVKKFTNQDLPFQPQQPVISSYYAVSTAAQTVINLSFSVDQTLTDQFFLFVDGKKLRLGASNDYTFTSVGSDNTSSQVTLNQALVINLNIQAYKLGLKNESEFGVDNRFTQLYAAEGSGFQGFIDQTSFINTAVATTGTPSAGTFYSSIVGRAPMVDLSQNLRPQMGIERIPTQTISPVQNEFGPNGEPVWTVPGDIFGQVRLGGVWNISAASPQYGPRLYTVTVGDFVEVTFYGTGLNILYTASNSGSASSVTVNGVAATGLSIPAASSAILGARNYNSNQVIPVVAGLALGMYTVKITMTTNVLDFSGLEIVNESSSVKVNSGIGYIQGKKYTSSSLQSFAFNSMATGTRGGRAVIYQNGDGTIGKAWQAVNGSQGNMASADHTNEEVARVYHYREFGASRTDDFSRISSTQAAAFTLEDGSTSLVATAASASSIAVKDSFQNNSASAYHTINFIGTGLDVVTVEPATAAYDNYTITVDGTNITTTAFASGTANTVKQQKIVSGLPYGLHTVRFTRNTAALSHITFANFVVYQPKKPSIPSGAIELADYNVMATFVANTVVGNETVSTGVLRKSPVREFEYVEGTGGTTSWSIDATSGLHPVGANLFSDRLNAYWEYVFFGTGFDYRFRVTSSSTANATVSLQSLSTGGSLQTLNATNFPTASFATYGTGVSFSAGTLDMNDASTQNGAGFITTGLPVGLYKIRVNNNSAGSFLQFQAFDVITPIHSYKSNIYADLQNTLPTGSNAISDNRKITPVKESLPSGKAWAQAVGVVSSPTTSSTSLVPMPDMSCTIKTSGGPIRISYSASVFHSSASGAIYGQIHINGIAVGVQSGMQQGGNAATGVWVIGSTFDFPVAAGTHKVDVYWYTTGATATAWLNYRSLLVEEK